MDCTSQGDNGFSGESLLPPLAPVIFPLPAARLVFQGSGQLELDTEIVNDLCSLLLAAHLLPAASVVFAELTFPLWAWPDCSLRAERWVPPPPVHGRAACGPRDTGHGGCWLKYH